MYKIYNLIKTCFACPSQWEAATEDGDIIYIRYRFGYLSWGKGKTLKDAVDNYELNIKIRIGDDFDGVMSTEEMLRLTGLIVTDRSDECFD